MSFPFGETVEFVSGAVAEDEYHNEIADWDNPIVMLTRHGVGWEKRPSTEVSTDSRNAITSGYTLYIWGEVLDIEGTWRANFRGSQWQVLGDSSPLEHPFTGWQAGTVVQLGRVDG